MTGLNDVSNLMWAVCRPVAKVHRRLGGSSLRVATIRSAHLNKALNLALGPALCLPAAPKGLGCVKCRGQITPGVQ